MISNTSILHHQSHPHSNLTYICICTTLRTHPHPQLSLSNHSWVETESVKSDQKDYSWTKSHVNKKRFGAVQNDDHIWLSRFTPSNNLINWIRTLKIWLTTSCAEKQLVDWRSCLWGVNWSNFIKNHCFLKKDLSKWTKSFQKVFQKTDHAIRFLAPETFGHVL